MSNIPYCLPKFTSLEIAAVNDLLNQPEKIISENYSKQCRKLLSHIYQKDVLLTHSCTAALEMAAILLDIQPGDEVIVPSYTFVSTANAFALFGAKLIFADIDASTLNIDPESIRQAITPKTKAIVIMHYAAVACDLDQIMLIAKEYNLPIIEDAAQCIGARYKDRYLGQFGSLSALSFHATKNITSGLGGALIVNDDTLLARAKVIWQKGTNREAFLEGIIDKYTWQDLGSSYMINELGAALLSAQLVRYEMINQQRINLWQTYHTALAEAEINYGFKRPTIPENCLHNGHIYYLIAPTDDQAASLRSFLAKQGIGAPFHYVPLHLSPAGKKFGKSQYPLPVSERIYKRVVRLPIWEGLEQHINCVIEHIYHQLQTQQQVNLC